MKISRIFAFLLAITTSGRAQTLGLVSTGLGGSPPISEAGQVAYPNNAGSAIYLGQPGAPIQLVVATNGPIAGSPPYTFSSLTGGQPIPNGTNQVAFYEGGG